MAAPNASAKGGANSAGREQPKAKTVSINDFKAAENQRRADIRSAFAGFRGQCYGVEELEQRCVDDMECSADAARNRLLAKIGEGAEPLGGSMGTNDETLAPHSSFRVGATGRDDGFLAAVTDGMLMRYGIAVKDPHPAARDFRGASIRDIARASIKP